MLVTLQTGFGKKNNKQMLEINPAKWNSTAAGGESVIKTHNVKSGNCYIQRIK